MANFRSGLLSALLGTAATAPAAAAPAQPAASAANPGEGLELTDEQRTQLRGDVEAYGTDQRAEGHAAGFKAATDRFSAVMNSDKGKANPSAALTALANPKASDWTADEIIAFIPEAPAAAAPAAPAASAADASRASAQQQLEATPTVALGNDAGAARAAGNQNDVVAGSEEAVSGWGKVQSESAKALTAGGYNWGRGNQQAAH
jgi:hypothetical protein